MTKLKVKDLNKFKGLHLFFPFYEDEAKCGEGGVKHEPKTLKNSYHKYLQRDKWILQLYKIRRGRKREEKNAIKNILWIEKCSWKGKIQ